MTTTLDARQASNSTALLTWDTTDTPPLTWEIERQVLPTSAVWATIAGLAADYRTFGDSTLEAAAVVGDTVTYRLVDPSGPTVLVTADPFTYADRDVPPTYGPVDPLVNTIRYTTLADVKKALGITDAAFDTELTQAIISAEVAIDQMNGRSFADTGINPAIPGIPEAIRVWALDASVAVWKLRDTPTGFTAGSDDWLGQIDATEAARRSLRRNPLALGYKVSWGLS
jgi:hypothetical protein